MKPTYLQVARIAIALCPAALPAGAIADARAPPAGIVLQRGSDGVEIGMTREQVLERWGQPDHINVSHLGESDVEYGRMRWDGPRLRAAFIDTTDSNDPFVAEHVSSLLSVAP